MENNQRLTQGGISTLLMVHNCFPEAQPRQHTSFSDEKPVNDPLRRGNTLNLQTLSHSLHSCLLSPTQTFGFSLLAGRLLVKGNFHRFNTRIRVSSRWVHGPDGGWELPKPWKTTYVSVMPPDLVSDSGLKDSLLSFLTLKGNIMFKCWVSSAVRTVHTQLQMVARPSGQFGSSERAPATLWSGQQAPSPVLTVQVQNGNE